MEFILEQKSAIQAEADVLAVLAFTRDKVGSAERDPLSETAAAVDTATGDWISELYESREFTGKSFDTGFLHRATGLGARRLLVVGAGAAAKFNAAEMRKVAGVVLRSVKGKGARTVCFALDSNLATAEMLEAVAEGALIGDFEPDQHKTDPKKAEKAVNRFAVSVGRPDNALAAALETGKIVGESQNFTRALVNEPANLLTPTRIASEAAKMAQEVGLECEILDEGRMRELGMGSLLGVSQGSREAPALVILRYKPSGTPVSSDHLALVGKGVTFDTGGVSIKPSDGMEKMKYDMAGAAAVIGAMRALAHLKPAIPVTAFAPCVENMVSDRAQRPGDIVTSLSGKTIEVLNTDAEGRLILVDALTYAIRQGCTHLVDAATLTGAIAVALAHIHAGLFANNEDLKNRLLSAAGREGERLWPMPMDADYHSDYLNSAFADIPNISGGRYGGAITAAKFLEFFVEEKPWAHLDIAGTAWLDDVKAFMSKGPTGMGMRTFVRLAMDWKA